MHRLLGGGRPVHGAQNGIHDIDLRRAFDHLRPDSLEVVRHALQPEIIGPDLGRRRQGIPHFRRLRFGELPFQAVGQCVQRYVILTISHR